MASQLVQLFLHSCDTETTLPCRVLRRRATLPLRRCYLVECSVEELVRVEDGLNKLTVFAVNVEHRLHKLCWHLTTTTTHSTNSSRHFTRDTWRLTHSPRHTHRFRHPHRRHLVTVNWVHRCKQASTERCCCIQLGCPTHLEWLHHAPSCTGTTFNNNSDTAYWVI